MNYLWIIQPMVLYLTIQSLYVFAVITDNKYPEGKSVHNMFLREFQQLNNNTLQSLSDEEDKDKGGRDLCRTIAAVQLNIPEKDFRKCKTVNPIGKVSIYGRGILEIKLLRCNCYGKRSHPTFYIRRRLGVLKDQYYVLQPRGGQACKHNDINMELICHGIYHIAQKNLYVKNVPSGF